MVKRVLLVVVSFLLLYLSTPIISLVSLRGALMEEDAARLTQYVNFYSVRESLKTQINGVVLKKLGQKENTNLVSMIGMAVAGPMVDQLVGEYVTPERIFELIDTGKPSLSALGESVGSTERDYTDPRSSKRFWSALIGVQWLNIGKIQLAFSGHKKQQATVFLIFEMHGLHWQLVEIKLPALENL